MEKETAVDKEAVRRIAQSREICIAPDGREYSVISLEAAGLIARDMGIPPKAIEIAALEQGIIPLRYLRNMGTIGPEGQVKLLRSAVAVVGVGGLGGTVVELLARQGVGQIIIIDKDRFTEENLNRQLMCTEKDLGEYKAVVAAKRVKEINSAVTVTWHTEDITETNVRELIKQAQVVADGLDNLSSRFLVEEACRGLGIPFVSGAIAGFGGQLTTIFPEDKGLSSVYGKREDVPERGVEVETGNPSATPTMIAAWQVQEVTKIVTGIGKPLRNRLLLLEAADGIAEVIQLA